jgi:hypothetical protein
MSSLSSKKHKKEHNKLVRLPRESKAPGSKRRAALNHNRGGPRLPFPSKKQTDRDWQVEEDYFDQGGDQEGQEEDAEEDADCGAGVSPQQDKVIPPGSPDLTMPPTTLFGTKRVMGTTQTQAPATSSKRLRLDANNATPPPNAYISSTPPLESFESTSPTDANHTTT